MTTTEMSSAREGTREADECIAVEMLSHAPSKPHPSPHFPRKVLPLGLGLLLVLLVSLLRCFMPRARRLLNHWRWYHQPSNRARTAHMILNADSRCSSYLTGGRVPTQ